MRTTSLSSAAASGAGFAAFVYPALDGGAAAQRAGRDDDRARLEEHWRARGHAAGYAEGLRAAAAEGEACAARQVAEHAALVQTATDELDRALAVLQSAARALDARTAPVLRDAEDTLLSVAMDLAEAIVGDVLTDETAAVRFALGRSGDGAGTGRPGAERHTVRVHPDDLALIVPGPDASLARSTAPQPSVRMPAGVELVADASLARGDAVSEFPDGYLDARIGNALQRARAALGQAAS
jgi:flagellar assembly protein FliH